MWASVLVVVVLGLHPGVLQKFSRANAVADALRAYEHGQPLLVAENSHGSLYPAGLGDDRGIFVLAPLLGALTGVRDPMLLARLLFLLFFVPSVLITPLLFRRITDSAAGALLAPIGLVGAALVFESTPYWASAWAVLGLIPIVMWIDVHWSRRAGALIVGIAALAGVASALRAQSGIAVLISLAIVLGTSAPWRISLRAVAFALAVGAYLLVSSTAMSTIEAHRDRYGPIAARYPDALHGHVFWHTAYIGLGYLPNNRGIWWDDAVALRAARRRDPQVRYLTQRYERVLQTLTLNVVKEDPGFVAATYFKKLVVSFAWAAPILLALLLTLSPALRTAAARTRRLLLLCAPPALINLLSPLLGLPVPEYLYGWLSALVLMSLVTLTLTLSGALRLLRMGRSFRSILFNELYPRPLRVGAAVIALGAITGWGIAIKSQADAWLAHNGGDLAQPPSTPPGK